MDKCEIVGCDEEARYYDYMGNQLCESCMKLDADETGFDYTDYEFIPWSSDN